MVVELLAVGLTLVAFGKITTSVIMNTIEKLLGETTQFLNRVFASLEKDGIDVQNMN